MQVRNEEEQNRNNSVEQNEIEQNRKITKMSLVTILKVSCQKSRVIIHQLINLFIYSFTYLLTYLFTYLFIYLFIHSFIHTCIHSFIYLSIYLSVYLYVIQTQLFGPNRLLLLFRKWDRRPWVQIPYFLTGKKCHVLSFTCTEYFMYTTI